MKLFDKLAEKIGQSNLTKLLASGFCTALISPAGMVWVIILSAIVIAVHVLKVKKVDEDGSNDEILYPSLGCAITIIFNFFFFFF